MIVKDKTQSLIIYEKGMFTRYLLEICYLYLQTCIICRGIFCLSWL